METSAPPRPAVDLAATLYCQLVYTLTDPPLRFLRKFLPPVQVGTVALDLAFLALAVGISVLIWLNAMFMH